MKKILYAIMAFGIILASCSKTEVVNPTNPTGATNLGDLVIPSNFNWSSSQKGGITVTLNPDVPGFASEGQELWIVDNSNNILDRSIISNDQAEFYYTIPQEKGSYRLFLPATKDEMPLTSSGNITFDVLTDILGDSIALMNRASNSGTNKKASKTAGVNLLVNGDMEINDFGLYSGSNSHTHLGKWFNLYSNSRHEWKNISGNRVYYAKSNNGADVIQSVPVTPGDLYTMSAVTGGTFCYYVYFKDVNNNLISYVGYNPTNNIINETGVVPANAAYALIYLHGSKTKWIDDVVFSTDPSVVDSDNDGEPDDTDDYPNDPARAFTSYFPTAGYQTLSFEDLWPAQGDFDMNDMVLNTNVVYTSDANNNRVDATFTVDVEAVGAGFSNGLAIVFTDANKQPIAQNIISGVSGYASIDPDVTNGIIVFNNVYDAQSEYYQNNGVGPSLPAETFSFTVSFNNNAGSQAIVPDIYIFRSNDRGLEIHLDGFLGTTKANTAYYNTVDDINGTYTTDSGLPWALEVITPNKSYKHPLEFIDILVAYPSFQGWAESSGSANQDWLDLPVAGKIFGQ